MKILMLTSYYYPHISGLTLYFQRLAEEYALLGHKVTVITSQHEKSLQLREQVNGVNVIRSPYLFKFNKGMFMHKILFDVYSALKEADVVHLNLPSTEALPVAILAKVLNKPVVTTYNCDITLPHFFGSKFLDKLIDINHILILKISDKLVVFTKDFARNSRVMKNFVHRSKEIFPIAEIKVNKIQPIEQLTAITGHKIGMVTRIAADKGIDYMLNAMPTILKAFPDATLILAGNMNAIGEDNYLASLQPLFKKYENNLLLLGLLATEQMPYFFRNIDLLVVASTNSTEAFGMVQAEAMLEGTPCVATNLPGVRVPIQLTGAGEIARIADSEDLAKKIISVLNKQTKPDRSKVKEIFNKSKAVKDYLEVYHAAILEPNR